MKPLYKKNFSSIKLLNSQFSLLLILASGATQKEVAAIISKLPPAKQKQILEIIKTFEN